MLNIEPLFDLSYRVHPSIDICKFAFHCHFSIYHRRGLFSQVGLDVIQIVRSLSACQRDPGASNFFFIQVESEWGRARRKSTICFDGALRTFETRLRVFIPPIFDIIFRYLFNNSSFSSPPHHHIWSSQWWWSKMGENCTCGLSDMWVQCTRKLLCEVFPSFWVNSHSVLRLSNELCNIWTVIFVPNALTHSDFEYSLNFLKIRGLSAYQLDSISEMWKRGNVYFKITAIKEQTQP